MPNSAMPPNNICNCAISLAPVTRPPVVAANIASIRVIAPSTSDKSATLIIFSRIAAMVVSIERYRRLAERARKAFDMIGYTNIEVICGDGLEGAPHRVQVIDPRLGQDEAAGAAFEQQ